MIASGSHIDSQTPGGRYDGALGVIAALVAMRTLQEQFGRPRRTLEAVVAVRGGGEPLSRRQLLGLARDHGRGIAAERAGDGCRTSTA